MEATPPQTDSRHGLESFPPAPHNIMYGTARYDESTLNGIDEACHE